MWSSTGPQTENEGGMAKILSDLVHRFVSAAEEGRAIPPVLVEGRPTPPGLVVEGGQPRARLAAGCGTRG